MAGLSSIFGGNDSDNSSDVTHNATDSAADVTSALGLDVNSSQSNFNQDEDGNTSHQTNDNSIGLDTDTDGLLSSVTDSLSGSEHTDS